MFKMLYLWMQNAALSGKNMKKNCNIFIDKMLYTQYMIFAVCGWLNMKSVKYFVYSEIFRLKVWHIPVRTLLRRAVK